MLRKQIQPNTLCQPKKRVRINEIAINAGKLEVNNSEVVQNIIMALWMRFDKSHNLLQIRLDRFHNLTMPRTDPCMGLDIKLIYKLAKSLTKTDNKMHELKTYNETINNPIYQNRQCKAIDKKLQNLDSH